MRLKLFETSSFFFLLLAQLTAGMAADHQIRSKRQNGYGNGNGMWNNENSPVGNWNGPNSNGYGGAGPQGPPPDDSIRGSIGTKEEVKPEDVQGSSNGQGGQGPWWPNGGPNGYNNGPNPNGYFNSGVGLNGYSNGQNPFNSGSPNGVGPVDDGIKGSIGAAVEPTRAPYPPNSYGYGNRAGYGNNNGYGTHGNQGFGFNRMSGYGNNFGRPILPRAERYSQRRLWRY